jgi:hypothetical protein
MKIKEYLLNQRALVVSEMAQLTKSGNMTFIEMNILSSKYIVIDQMIRELNQQHGKKTSKKNEIAN